MDKLYVNMFNGVLDKRTKFKVSVLDVIWYISEGRWKDKIEAYREEKDPYKKSEMKKLLPAATFSGTISGESRLDTNVDTYTGIVVCDIDKLNQTKLSRYKNRLISDNNVLAFFESPSYGLKVLFKVNSSMNYHKSHAFPYLVQYMKKRHDIDVDPSGSNPSRLCFMSYDPDMYFNEECETVDIDTSAVYDNDSEEMTSVRRMSNNYKPSNDTRHVFKTCIKWTRNSKVGNYHKGNRNKFVFYLSCLLCEAGMAKDTTVMMIVQRYASLGIKEITTTVRSAYKKCNSRFGIRPVYQKKSNQSNLFD